MDAAYAYEQEPLVSIVTATYNRAKILVESTLPSVLAQSHPNIEWVIMGDCCTDETEDLLAKINDPRIRFWNLPSRPQYPRNKVKRWKIAGIDALNLAHKMARGSWSAHLDDDDIFTPDHIENLLKYAQAGNYEIVSARCKMEYRPGEWIERGDPVPTGYESAIGHVSHSTVFSRAYLDRCFAYTPEALKVNMAADAYRWRRMVNAGVRFGFVNEVSTIQPLRPGEASRSIFQPE
jgi:glycosyltransferase involved in cell wall biosynthesis